MEEKLNSTIEKIVRLSGQNAEFNTELRKRLGISAASSSVSVDDVRLDHIYEYCIEKVVRQQATEFYADFPIKSIINGLVDDFCRMETFRRKNAFGDFCLSLYQQLERIANTLCVNPDLNEIAARMWGYSAYVKTGKDITPSIDNRIEGDYTIASLVFPGQNKKTGMPYAIEKSKSSLQTQYAIDKIRIIVYFVCYQGAMKSSDYDGFVELTTLFSDIYQCRNTNHRGNTLTPWEEATLKRVLSQQAVYYFKFLGALTQFVEQIKQGWGNLQSIKLAVLKMPSKAEKLAGPKVLGKIDLPDDGKKRFK